MEKVIKIRGDRVLVEKGGRYYEKPIDTLEQQDERRKNEELGRMIKQM